jgi:hypothetical protein
MNEKEYKDQVRAEEREGLYGEVRRGWNTDYKNQELRLLGNRIGNGKEASGRDQTKVNAPQIWCPVVDLTVVMSESEGAGEERGNKYTGFSSMACTFRAWGLAGLEKEKHMSVSAVRGK